MPESTNTPGSASFLEAEEVARQLADSLARLKDESNRYSAASDNLDDAATALKSLASETQALGEQAAQALKTVISIGGPQIIERLKIVEDAVNDVSMRFTKLLNILIVISTVGVLSGLTAIIIAVLK